jgi:hypothetical protein
LRFNSSLLTAFNAQLQEQDAFDKTVGCRHICSEICGSAYLDAVFAFSSNDDERYFIYMGLDRVTAPFRAFMNRQRKDEFFSLLKSEGKA